MPTFDFANILRKIVTASLAVALNPLTAVLSVAGTLTALLIYFEANVSIPDIVQVPEVINIYDTTGLLDLLLYCVNWPLLHTHLAWCLNFLRLCLGYFLTYCSSLLFVLVSVGIFKVVRRKIRDFVS